VHEPLSVTQLTRQLKDCLEGNFPLVAVRGEVSGATHAASGHAYFTLKDENAQLRVVMWNRTARRIRFDVADGIEVVAIGAIELYAPRGTYQLVVEDLIPEGIGPLELAFRQLHEKLGAEGLFAPERKRSIPRFPRRIALVTSPTGAAIRDMLQIITRRWKQSHIVVVPVPVQGDAAAPAIARALQQVHRLEDVEVVVVGRGGGSLEDLWAFNEEIVARAIAGCKLPVVSAVGHEIDVTIADLVADRRALTPSEAAELVVPDAAELRDRLEHVAGRLAASLRERAVSARRHLEMLAGRRVLTRPFDRLLEREIELDEWQRRLTHAVRARRQRSADEISRIAASLNALSPLNVLERGYSITQTADGSVVKDRSQVEVGDTVTTRLHRGSITSRVESAEA
jgi:exodeoxyribonuclease VII large subunit